MTNNPASFRAEARYQRCCAVCGSTDAFHAHHVVDKQRLRQLNQPLDDPRNALRLCVRCHMQHEWAGPGKVEIELKKLTDDNLDYAYELLGSAATVYLERHYIGDDPRLARFELREVGR